MRKVSIVLLLALFTVPASSQETSTIWEINQMRFVDSTQLDSTSRSIRLNWMKVREYAKANGHIKDYQVLYRETGPKFQNPGWDVLLMTEYKDSLQVKYFFDHYTELCKKANPNSPSGFVKVNGKPMSEYIRNTLYLPYKKLPFIGSNQ